MSPLASEPLQADLAQIYRSQASSALGYAEKASNRELKELYLRVAECWCSLAQFETLALGIRC